MKLTLISRNSESEIDITFDPAASDIEDFVINKNQRERFLLRTVEEESSNWIHSESRKSLTKLRCKLEAYQSLNLPPVVNVANTAMITINNKPRMMEDFLRRNRKKKQKKTNQPKDVSNIQFGKRKTVKEKLRTRKGNIKRGARNEERVTVKGETGIWERKHSALRTQSIEQTARTMDKIFIEGYKSHKKRV